jgi:2-polyprenyl-3-methyl-5-hydroxy-6-metoxy-1,4-benzoquinol methylase
MSSVNDDVRIGGGDTATPHNLRKRVAFLESAIGLRNRRVLDAGCGAGEYVEAFALLGADVVGLEFNLEKVTRYLQRHPGSKRVMQGELSGVPLPSESFDVIVLNEVLEHVPDQLGALREMRRLLRKGGRLAVFSPNRIYPFETHGVCLRKSGRTLTPWIPFIPYVPVGLGQRWFIYPARNYWPRELRRVVESGGFHVTQRHWIWQTFENISGRQPAWAAWACPGLRAASDFLEKFALVRRLGATQVVLAEAA